MEKNLFQVHNGVYQLVLSSKLSKLDLRVFLAGHTVAIVTYCVTKLTPA